MKITASVYYRAEKPYGVGRNAHERHMRIEPGWRAQVIDGLERGHSIYTGVNPSREAAIAELVSALQAAGLSGRLSIV